MCVVLQQVNVFWGLFPRSVFISSNSHVADVVMFVLVKAVQRSLCFKLQNGDWIQMAQKTVPLTAVWNYGIMGTSDVKP